MPTICFVVAPGLMRCSLSYCIVGLSDPMKRKFIYSMDSRKEANFTSKHGNQNCINVSSGIRSQSHNMHFPCNLIFFGRLFTKRIYLPLPAGAVISLSDWSFLSGCCLKVVLLKENKPKF